MFFTRWEPYLVKRARPLTLTCERCGNSGDHTLHCFPTVGLGVIFSKKPLIAAKKFAFVCPVCGTPSKQVTKDQLGAYLKG